MHVLNVRPEAIFQALSEPVRIRIIRLLTVSRGEACLCDLSESLDEPDYKLSRHMKVLRQVGLLSAEKEGRWVYHKVIQGRRQLDKLYRLIEALPDIDRLFQTDLKRYQRRKSTRDDARCKSKPVNQMKTRKKKMI